MGSYVLTRPLTANAPSYLHNLNAANNSKYSVYPNDCNTLEKADEHMPCIVIDFEIIQTLFTFIGN